jgi:hypothetical protein
MIESFVACENNAVVKQTIRKDKDIRLVILENLWLLINCDN